MRLVGLPAVIVMDVIVLNVRMIGVLSGQLIETVQNGHLNADDKLAHDLIDDLPDIEFGELVILHLFNGAVVFVPHGRGHFLPQFWQIKQFAPIPGTGSAKKAIDIARPANIAAVVAVYPQFNDRMTVILPSGIVNVRCDAIVFLHQGNTSLTQQVVLSKQPFYLIGGRYFVLK